MYCDSSRGTCGTSETSLLSMHDPEYSLFDVPTRWRGGEGVLNLCMAVVA